MPTVFLSYPSLHGPWASALGANLERALGPGCVFLDQTHLAAGCSWVSGLEAGLSAATHVVLVAAPESFASPWVRNELETFQASHPHWKQQGLIQVALLVDTPLPPFLQPVQYADFRDHDAQRYRRALQRLLEALRHDTKIESQSSSEAWEIPAPPHTELASGLRAELVRVLSPVLARKAERPKLLAALALPAGALDGHGSPNLAASALLVTADGRQRERATRVLEVVLEQGLLPAAEVRELLERLGASGSARLDPPSPLCHPTGTVPCDSPLYVRRATDAQAEEELDRPHGMVHVLAPRQMGKSSLLTRLAERARRPGGPLVVTVNFQDLDLEALADLRSLLTALAAEMLEAAGRDPGLAQEIQRSTLTAKLACRRLLAREVLDRQENGVLLLMDETDRLVQRSGGCAHDFLVMLRAWHEAGKGDPILARLKLAFSFCTEADMIAPGVAESPLHNVGLQCRLADFDVEQVAELIGRHGLPEARASAPELTRVLGGNPYLVRTSLYALASEGLEWPDVLRLAREFEGPLGQHLRHHRRHLEQRPELTQALRAALDGKPSIAPEPARVLESMGLLRRAGRAWAPRCPLYEEVFGGIL